MFPAMILQKKISIENHFTLSLVDDNGYVM